ADNNQTPHARHLIRHNTPSARSSRPWHRITRFFFSSRRRHTRCLSDWSSDVCSSDLTCRRRCRASGACGTSARPRRARPARSGRSEERRVGKECKCGRGPELLEKNEVEGVRAAKRLPQAINGRLNDKELYDRNVRRKE